MASAKLYPPTKPDRTASSPLPTLLQTPSGLALLELQGTVNLPSDSEGTVPAGLELGKLDFPNYVPDAPDQTAWMKGVHLYVGQHQRLTGEVKKLPKALAVVRRRQNTSGEQASSGEDQLEVVEIVKYKLLFASRPEPVGTANAS